MDNTPFIIELPEALVTKELWLAAQTCGYNMRADDTRSFLFEGLVECPMCGKMLAFPTYTSMLGKMTCTDGHGVTYSTAAVESVVLELLSDHLIEAATDEFRTARKTELEKVNAESMAMRADLEAKVADFEKRILNAYRNSLQMDPQAMKYADTVLAELRGEQDRYAKQLLAMPKLLGLSVPTESAAEGIREELAHMAESAPFRANTPEDETMMERVRDLVSGIKLIPSDGIAFDVRVTFRTIAHSLDKTVEREAKNKVLTTRDLNEVERMESFGELIDTFQGRLTDEEWLSMPKFRGCNLAAKDARDSIDAALIWSELNVSHYSVMRHWGYEPKRCNGPGMLLNARDEILIEHLRKTRGPDFDMRLADPTPRGSECERLRYVRHPLLLLPVCQRDSGVTDLDDAQWAAITDIFSDLRYHKFGFHSAREALSSYFRLVRSPYGRTQILLVGGTERHHRYVQVLYDTGIMDQIARALLALEGFVVPDDYQMPTPVRGQLRTKTSIPEIDDVIRYLSGVFGRQAVPNRTPRVTRKLRLGTVIVDTDLYSAWTTDGVVVPLTMRLIKALIFLMERPNEIVSGDEIHRGARGIGADKKGDFTKEGSHVVNDVRRMLKKYCPVAWKSIKTLTNWRAVGNYIMTEVPVVVEGDAERAPIAFVPEPERPKLVKAIANALKETAGTESGREALEFIFNGAAKNVVPRSSLAYRLIFIQRKLQPFFPRNKNAIERLAHMTRRYDDRNVYIDTTYQLRGLGRAVRVALMDDDVITGAEPRTSS